MAMKLLKEDVERMAEEELNRANKNFPLFNSKHEGYAVIKEEAEETREALEEAENTLQCVWDTIRGKKTSCFMDSIDPQTAYQEYINVACEAIQTAAMLLKYDMSLSGNESEDQANE